MSPTSFEHARSHERKWFRWAIGWMSGMVIAALMILGGQYWAITTIKNRLTGPGGTEPPNPEALFPQAAMTLVGTGYLGLVICVIGFIVSFIAWLLALHRRRKVMERSDERSRSVMTREPPNPARNAFSSLVGWSLIFVAMVLVNLWFSQWKSDLLKVAGDPIDPDEVFGHFDFRELIPILALLASFIGFLLALVRWFAALLRMRRKRSS